MTLIVQNRVPLRAGIASVSATIADATAPTVPTGLQATAASSSQINLSWNASSDNLGVMQSGVAAYRIRRDGAFLVDVAHPTLTYSDTGLVSSQTYGYTVAARDVAGNESAQSAAANATTNAATNQWLSFTGPTFILGTASNWSFDPYDPSSATAFQWASGSAAPPAGVSLDSPGKRLVYNGGGSVGVTNNLILEDTQNAEADWLARIAGSGVVWYHDFRSAAEVNAFRWSGGYGGGNDPLAVAYPSAAWCRHITTDGVTGGGCMESFRAAGSSEPSLWWRPFSPLSGASNGRGIDDPGANGTLPIRTLIATDGGTQTRNFAFGWYAHPSSDMKGNVRDGGEFYLQMRVKMDPRRTISGMAEVGKLFIMSAVWQSNISQKIVNYSGSWAVSGAGQPNYHRMYATDASGAIEQYDSLGRPGQQVGHDGFNYTSVYCDINNPSLRGNCWSYSFGWDTLMFHLIPGRPGVQEQRIEVYAAHEGETSYTKIWDMIYATDYSSQVQISEGYQSIDVGAYHNGTTMPSDFYQRYDQIIFSRSFIPCPQV